ncbi:unnamed protein product [Bursaphelenchus okinawaensis]|uniref:Bromodomain associated domain-containing protein n=1 Tax=Bursaphelenchus okinawaensis TaxID=465554 RepID=A0A811KB91_9BILA|nr:unnamed protein product [Bursaphelenchus okinawaensis]CAG9097045.1 unnamed protein product [Bursaphelenchus okinawaensis]
MIENPTEELGRRAFQRSIALVLDNMGFKAATKPVIELLGLLAKRYFEDLCKRMALHRDFAGHEFLRLKDMEAALDDQGIDVEELYTYVLQVGSFYRGPVIPKYPVNLQAVIEAEVYYSKKENPIERRKVKEDGHVQLYHGPCKHNIPDFSKLTAVQMGYANSLKMLPTIPISSESETTPVKVVKKAKHIEQRKTVKRRFELSHRKGKKSKLSKPKKTVSDPTYTLRKAKSSVPRAAKSEVFKPRKDYYENEKPSTDRPPLIVSFKNLRSREVLDITTAAREERIRKEAKQKKKEKKKKKNSSYNLSDQGDRSSSMSEAIETFTEIFGNGTINEQNNKAGKENDNVFKKPLLPTKKKPKVMLPSVFDNYRVVESKLEGLRMKFKLVKNAVSSSENGKQ